MQRLIVGLIVLVLGTTCAFAQSDSRRVTTEIEFAANGNRLSGLLDVPESGEAKALVILVHGYGGTNVVEGDWYGDLRTLFPSRGVATFVWDKPGQGRSEGTFDINRPVQESAEDVLAAAAYLRSQNVPGSQKIGLWGVSRAGWIVPLAMAEDDRLAFWISVSGVDGLESFGYLLRSNWEVLGYEADRIELLYAEWRDSSRLSGEGGSYEDYMAMTENLRADPFYQRMNGTAEDPTKEGYEAFQKTWMANNPKYDPETGLFIAVEDFDEVLSGLDVPVLALFGEKDRSVDWKSTKALYERTIGMNPNAELSIRTFADGNHNLHVSDTGSFEEMLEILNNPQMVPGYYQTLAQWIDDVVE